MGLFMVTAGLAAVYGNYNISFMKAKMKDDAIAQLSDQLLAISTRLQELERK